MTHQRRHGSTWFDDEAMPRHTSRSPSEVNDVRTSSGRTIRREARAHRKRKINMAKREIESLRGKVTRSRLELRECRVELGQRRAKFRQMQAQFWRELRVHWEKDAELDKGALAELYDEMDRTLDESGPEEESYDEKEDDLDLLEYKLSKLENRFYDTDAELSEGGSGFTSSSSSSSIRSRSAVSNHNADDMSVSRRYLSRVGDANIVRERLLELEAEKSQYLDIEQNRAAMGLDSYQPNIEFLATFEDVKNAHLDELRGIGEDLRELQDLQKLESDLNQLEIESVSTLPSASHGLQTTDIVSQPDVFRYEIEGPKMPDHSAIRRYKSDGDLPDVSDDAPTLRERINQWMFEILDDSAIERARLRTIFADQTAWWTLVEKYWQKDLAATSPPLSRRGGHPSSSHVSRQCKSLSMEPPPNLVPPDFSEQWWDSPPPGPPMPPKPPVRVSIRNGSDTSVIL